MLDRANEGCTAFKISGHQAECPICGDQQRSDAVRIRGLPIVRCPGCGLISLNLHASGDNSPGRCMDQGSTWEAADGYDKTAVMDSGTRYLDALAERGLRDGAILVVGSTMGPLIWEAERRGFEVHVKRSLQDGDQLGLETKGYYAAVVLLYQLERCTSPLRLLESVHDVLMPGGVLLVICPSLDSWPARFFGHRWIAWRPENRFYFNRLTIHAVLLRSGFCEVLTRPDARTYTIEHLYQRVAAYPETGLTKAVGLLYKIAPAVARKSRVRLNSSSVMVTARRTDRVARQMCSIIVPVYNERATFSTLMDALLEKQLQDLDKQIIVVESNSSDGTREEVLRYVGHPEVKVVLQEKALGKGNAVRAGLQHADGQIVMIQDADLEYDLDDYDAVLEPVRNYRAAFVLGARHGGHWKMRRFAGQKGIATLMNFGHICFTSLINLLFGLRLKDPFTMFKVFWKDCLFGLDFTCNRFDFDHELLIKLVLRGYIPIEIPVNYRSRSFSEGKKIRLWRDPLSWLVVDLKLRLFGLRGRAH